MCRASMGYDGLFLLIKHDLTLLYILLTLTLFNYIIFLTHDFSKLCNFKVTPRPTLTSPCNNCLYSSNIKTDLALTGDSQYRSPHCITDLPANGMFDGLSKISINLWCTWKSNLLGTIEISSMIIS